MKKWLVTILLSNTLKMVSQTKISKDTKNALKNLLLISHRCRLVLINCLSLILILLKLILLWFKSIVMKKDQKRKEVPLVMKTKRDQTLLNLQSKKKKRRLLKAKRAKMPKPQQRERKEQKLNELNHHLSRILPEPSWIQITESSFPV